MQKLLIIFWIHDKDSVMDRISKDMSVVSEDKEATKGF